MCIDCWNTRYGNYGGIGIMEEKKPILDNEVIIEIVHSIKDIIIELIVRAFPRTLNE